MSVVLSPKLSLCIRIQKSPVQTPALRPKWCLGNGNINFRQGLTITLMYRKTSNILNVHFSEDDKYKISDLPSSDRNCMPCDSIQLT